VKHPVTVAALLALAACSGPNKEDGTQPGTTVDTGTPGEEPLADIYINEFMASNTMTHQDASGAYPDWVELYNASSVDAAIGGWWLTDDNDDIFKWQIPDDVVVPAGGYIVIFCDGDTDQGSLHANFNLDAAGEDLGLYGPNVRDNPVIDAIDDYGQQLSDVSLARSPDGSPTFVADDTPTPGASNGG
jgi:hypothetical protein